MPSGRGSWTRPERGIRLKTGIRMKTVRESASWIPDDRFPVPLGRLVPVDESLYPAVKWMPGRDVPAPGPPLPE